MAQISAGNLDRPISILQRADADAQDAFGSVDRSKGWAVLHALVWSEYMPIGAAERVGLLSAHNAVSVDKYRARWLEGVAADMAVQDDGVIKEIVAVAPMSRREEMIITVVERQRGTGTR